MARRSLGLTQAAGNFVNNYMMGKEFKARQEAEEEQKLIRGLMGQALTGSGSPESMEQLASLSPDNFLAVSQYLQQQEQAKTAQQQALDDERDKQDLMQLLASSPEQQNQILEQRVIDIQTAGGDPSDSQFLLGLNPDQRSKYFNMMAGEAGIQMPDPVQYEQGKGDMAGYSFNKSTGLYSADPALLEQLRLDAESKRKDEGLLTGKDLAGINDKVTGLVKDADAIVKAAKSLEALEGSSSPAAQLAAVFKFMKANDPTSTVRESEQGQVYAAEGAMRGFAAKLNQLVGKGGLSEENFNDLVNTAKIMANSAVDSTEASVGSYLTVLEDSLSKKAYQDLTGRVPSRLDTQAMTSDEAASTVDQLLADITSGATP